MQIHIVQRDTRAKLSIINTNKGREALKCDEPTPRERQLLLLLDKEDSELSKQAVELLLTKVDLNKIARKGWVEYHVLDDHAVTVNLSDKHDFEQKFDKDTEQKTGQKKIKNFLNTYHQEQQTLVAPIVVEADNIAPPSTSSIKLPEAVADDFEDLMVIQTLLNN